MSNLQFGAFVFEYNPRKIEVSLGSAMVSHLLPGYGNLVQHLGPKCRVVRCEGEVFAPTADQTNAKLSQIADLCGGGEDALFLPSGQRMQAYVSRFSYNAQGDGRVISYMLEFTEASSGGEE
ncbi:hypothetical protein [Youxingia wuxianensis]|uniref:Uncharacterized protein n=1 Tax=Youxingia wuxianensis TaxID=2763678 RepID=A0A926EL10_9FIRM|nr:hypothetical protein [Youxingia wuxianensis]MBC8585333.1 hypothetical protein [Youxingia wuxianensis]